VRFSALPTCPGLVISPCWDDPRGEKNIVIERNLRIFFWEFVDPKITVNPKIAGKWMFIPLKMVLIGIDPYPNNNDNYLVTQ
jgi:hypothetical protein